MTTDNRHDTTAMRQHGAIVPAGRGIARYDPARPDRLARQGLEFLLLRDAQRPDAEAGESPLPVHTLELLVQEMAAAMIPSVAALVGESDVLARKQQTLALACVHTTARTPIPADSPARHQLGLLTDVVSDEDRYPWWRALPLQVAMNLCGDGTGGLRTLHANLAHRSEVVRTHLLPIAWIARRRLDPLPLADALLPNVVGTDDHWAASLAIIHAVCPHEGAFTEIIDAWRSRGLPDVCERRLIDALHPDGPTGRYIDTPPDFTRIEQSVQREVLRAATTTPDERRANPPIASP